MMKSKLIVSFVVLCLIAVILFWLGVGLYSSSSAVRDLKSELESIYGMEYTGKCVENGTEDMAFVVSPKTWFLTNWNLRNMFGLDYRYECKVVFTTYMDGRVKNVRTITYQAVDPMGAEKIAEGAALDLGSKVEKTENQ